MTKFLGRFLRFWKHTLRPPDVLPAVVAPAEPTVKFLLEEGHLSQKERTVNQAAFKPSKKTKSLSVYRTRNLENDEAFEIGRQYVTELLKDKKPILAGAYLKAEVYYEQKLNFDPDGKPHPRHANVIDWPWEGDVQRELRVILARQARLILPADG